MSQLGVRGVFEPVIGIEVHAQLKTESKLFCPCSTRFDASPNSNTCPICLGLPGALPVLNKKVLEYGIKTGLAFNCQIAESSGFDRKNYFYPDLSKNYQITQDAFPIGTNGHIDVMSDGTMRRVRIKRVHLEEDAGKSVHEGGAITGAAFSLEDYNRAGVPLLEIVSEPDIRSPKEAYEYLLMLRRTLLYLGVSDCKMEEGSLRCDVNISIRPRGSEKFWTQVELKNLNSFRAVERSLEYEVQRQSQVVADGGEVVRETRHWDETSQVTVSMRRKERAEDYRYFPEPDLPRLSIKRAWVDEIEATLPELPWARRMRFIRDYELPEYDASLLTDTQELADYFEAALDHNFFDLTSLLVLAATPALTPLSLINCIPGGPGTRSVRIWRICLAHAFGPYTRRTQRPSGIYVQRVHPASAQRPPSAHIRRICSAHTFSAHTRCPPSTHLAPLSTPT